MTPRAFDEGRLRRLEAIVARHVDEGDVPGLAWVVARRGEVHAGAAGTRTAGEDAPVRRDSIFRIASMTKPILAAAALTFVEECRIGLDEAIDPWLPELADRRVLARPDGPLDETVPAERPISLRDLLTLRLGVGLGFAGGGRQTVMDALAERGLGVGPPQPATYPEPDEWLHELGALPLERQPGERWLYHLGSEVLGVLVARIADQPLDRVLAERVVEPLGMTDTGFWVPPDSLDRFGACHRTDPSTGRPVVFDPADGQWSTPPRFCSGGGGLVSTVDDHLAFARMLLGGGSSDGVRVLSRASVAAMTTNQLTDAQVASSGLGAGVATGWGFGMAVVLGRTGTTSGPGAYGWDGGLGSSWLNDPAEDLVGVLLTNQMWTSPVPPRVVEDFWTATYAALGD